MSDERLKELSALATYQFAAIFNEKNMQMTIGEIVEKLYDVDLVRVVRCKDCKHFVETGGTRDGCFLFQGMTNPRNDDFCSEGERK